MVNQNFDTVASLLEYSKSIPDRVLLVDFWAAWCGPCRQLGPVLEGFARKNDERVVLVKVNVDENASISQELNIQSIPTVFFLKNGKIYPPFVGVYPESVYAAALAEV